MSVRVSVLLVVSCLLVAVAGCGGFLSEQVDASPELVQAKVVEGQLAKSQRSTDVPPDQSSSRDDRWYNSTLLDFWLGDYLPVDQLKITDPRELEALVKRGGYLVNQVAACGTCHGSVGQGAVGLSGGRKMRDSFGEVFASNITSDRSTGIGLWTVGELMRALREGIDRRGRPLSLEAHGLKDQTASSGYRWMADRDAMAIAVYLMSTKPVNHSVARRHIGGFERNDWGILPVHEPLVGYVPSPPRANKVAYGGYLFRHVSRCGDCHSFADVDSQQDEHSAGLEQKSDEPLTGDDSGWVEGLFAWSAAERKIELSNKSASTYVRHLSSADAGVARGRLSYSAEEPQEVAKLPGIAAYMKRRCPTRYYSGMSEEDRNAIASFIRSQFIRDPGEG